MLEVRGLCKNFGGLCAIDDLDLDVAAGEVHGVIGPNGSGKSTMFNLVTGIYEPDSGAIRFNGEDIAGREPHEVAKRGIGRTFQLLRIWPEMTLLENVMVGQHNHIAYGPVAALTGLGRRYREERRVMDEARGLLEFVGLADYAELLASELSIGQRRLLVLARALAMKPKLLLLDEPAAGLSVVNVDNMISIIRQMREKYGITLVVVEHILRVVMESCDTISVLDHGQKIAAGRPEQIKEDHKVIEAYLGEELDDDQIRAKLSE